VTASLRALALFIFRTAESSWWRTHGRRLRSRYFVDRANMNWR